MKVAGIDVHKKVLMVVVDARTPEEKPARRRFVTMPSDRVRRQNQIECLLEEMLIKLSIVV